MKINLLSVCVSILSVPLAFAQNPSVQPGSITFDSISHSAARVFWQAGSGSGQWLYSRMRYIASPGDCTSGTGGTVTEQDDPEAFKYGTSGIIGGLSANTTYMVCPEGSLDRQTYYGGVGATFTTAALPATHPAPPIAPTRFNTDYPDTTGYNSVVVHSGGDCSDIETAINTAITIQKTTGTIINVDAGSVCTGRVVLTTRAPDVTPLPSSAFNTSTYTIHSTSHGLSEGQQVIWTTGGRIPGQNQDLSFAGTQDGPVIEGYPYWIHKVDNDNFQVYYGAPYGSPCEDDRYEGKTCPHLWQFSNSGSGTIMYAPWPRNLKWIIVRTSTPDSQFVPEHVRANPNWASKMARIQIGHYALPGYQGFDYTSLGFDGGRPFSYQDHFMIANIRFVGMEVTYQPYPQAATTADPPPGLYLILTEMNNSNIIFDRCYLHGWPTPFRVFRMFWLDGANIAFVDTDIRDMNTWHTHLYGLTIHQ